MTGVGIGAAIAGMNPILVHQRMDFLMLTMNQLVNMASKIHYISDGRLCVPIVIRACIGKVGDKEHNIANLCIQFLLTFQD